MHSRVTAGTQLMIWFDLWNQSFRVVLRNDVVSTLPGPPFYVHGGQEVHMIEMFNVRFGIADFLDLGD